MPDANVAIRRFRWPDAPELARLQGKSDEAMTRWLRQPNLRPERDCLVAERDGRTVDYAYLVVEEAIGRGVLLASANDPLAVRGLLDASIASASELGLGVVHIDVREDDAERRALCESAGMAHVRTHLHLIKRDSSPTGVGLPPSMTVRLATRGDVPAVTALQNTAFTGSWGYSPNTPEEIAYRIFDAPNDPPDPVVMLEVNGVLRGYCWAHRETHDSPGMVGMVGVAPDQRNKGYGRLATAAGIDHLVRMGALPVIITVDSANGPAIRVYESLGFVLDWRSVWYEARLR